MTVARCDVAMTVARCGVTMTVVVGCYRLVMCLRDH